MFFFWVFVLCLSLRAKRASWNNMFHFLFCNTSIIGHFSYKNIVSSNETSCHRQIMFTIEWEQCGNIFCICKYESYRTWVRYLYDIGKWVGYQFIGYYLPHFVRRNVRSSDRTHPCERSEHHTSLYYGVLKWNFW